MSQPLAARPRSRPATGSAEYSRKDKSLGLLCENFVQEFGTSDNHVISLDGAAETLGVERRRIYDIVNVLESVGIVARQAKNCYAWRGFSQIHHKLDDLQAKANSDLYGGPEDFRAPPASRANQNSVTRNHSNVKHPRRSFPHGNSVPGDATHPDASDTFLSSSIETEADAVDQQQYQLHHQTPQTAHAAVNPVAGTPGSSAASNAGRTTSRKEKSLGVLSQRFVQLFLMAGKTPVSLENAAVQLLGRSPSDADPLLGASSADGDASKLLKTKVRRLYDIANILTSLNLIEKVHTVNRKPAFKWLGPENCCAAMTTARTESDGLKRSNSFVSIETRTRPGAAKRRKTISGSVYGAEGETGSSIFGSSSNCSFQGDCYEQVQPGFDHETMHKITCVIDGFPESYAKRWRDYVDSVNAMMMRGQVTREKAYDSVANVVNQYKEREHGPIPRIDHLSGRDMENDQAVQHPRRHSLSHANSSSSTDRGNSGSGCARSSLNSSPGAVGTRTSSDFPHQKVEDAIASAENGEQGKNIHEDTDIKPNNDHAHNASTAPSPSESSGPPTPVSSFPGNSTPALTNSNPAPTTGETQGTAIDNIATVHGNGCYKKENASVSGVDNVDDTKSKPVTDSNDVEAGCSDRTTCSGPVATSSMPTATANNSTPRGINWTQENIDLYMRRAQAAGPEYERAAQQWLKDLRNWQKLWATSFSALQSMPMNMTATAPTASAVNATAPNASYKSVAGSNLQRGDSQPSTVDEKK